MLLSNLDLFCVYSRAVYKSYVFSDKSTDCVSYLNICCR